MLELLEQELLKQDIFNNDLPNIVNQLTNTISAKIPYRMKLALAIHELIVFTTQFRRNILHWNKSIIPTNGLTFVLSKSGSSKDSSVKAIRKCFEESYNKIQLVRLQRNENMAITEAVEQNAKNPKQWSTYKEYLKPLNPMIVAPSTVEGFIQHLNDIDALGISSGALYSGEFGSELATNSDMTSLVKLLAELFDEGSKEVKVLKDRNNQSKEIKNLPVSALLVGSEDNILLDENIKRKFKTEFTTKLARRSFFYYSKEGIEPPKYNSVADMLKAEKETEFLAVENKNKATKEISKVCDYLLDKIGEPITVDDKVIDLFLLYKRYNEEVANTMEYQLQISKLSRQHLQWKALKLSGVFACFRCSDKIEEEDYKQAVTYTEMLHNDIILFEKELSKEPYEMFVDYINTYIGNDTSMFVDSGTLKKLGYIPNGSNILSKIKDLTVMASTYDNTGIYTPKEDGVYYMKIIRNKEIGVSYLNVSGCKEDRKDKCAKGYKYEQVQFCDLSAMLEEDLVYIPFKFSNGIRSKENVIGKTGWVALDVDKSTMTDEEAHLILEDVNHHIARTSDINNAYKFRVLVELDTEVDVSDNEWVFFIQSIAKELGLDVDPLPKSQIFYSFSGRKVLSVTDASPLSVKEHIIYASNKALSKTNKPIPASVKSSLLNNRRETFAKAYEARDGEGSRKLIWSAKYAKELGADKQEIIDIVTEINNFWVYPLPEDRFNKTIISQINRWF